MCSKSELTGLGSPSSDVNNSMCQRVNSSRVLHSNSIKAVSDRTHNCKSMIPLCIPNLTGSQSQLIGAWSVRFFQFRKGLFLLQIQITEFYNAYLFFIIASHGCGLQFGPQSSHDSYLS